MNSKILTACILLAIGGVANAQSTPPDPVCPDGTTSCTISEQNMGDVDNSSTAEGTQSTSSQSGTSSNSNQSGNTMDASYDNSAQTTQNATNTTTGTISGGNTSSEASGNKSENTNDNHSSVGDTSSNSGGNVMKGGDNTASATGGKGGSVGDTSNGNNTMASDTTSTTVVDAGDHSSSSYNSQALFIPTVQVAPPNIVAGANVIVDRGSCGPLQAVESTPLNGVYFSMFGQRSVKLGSTDRLVAYDGGMFRNEGGRLMGHRPVSYIAVIGVAGSRSIGLGGGKTGGDWGSGGASGGSSMQRLVVQTNLESCVFAEPAPRVIEVAAKAGKQ